MMRGSSMLPKDLAKHTRAAVWTTHEELSAFVGEAAALPPTEILRVMLPLLTDRALGREGAPHRNRCTAFAMLVEARPSEEYFAPLARALRAADPALRTTIGGLLPIVNSPQAHGDLCEVLDDDDEETRAVVAKVLGQVGGRSALAMLTGAALRDKFPGRMEAMDALVPRAGAHGIPLLTAVLTKGQPRERARALRYLSDTRLMAKDLAGARAAVERGLSDPDVRVFGAAIGALGALAEESEFIDAVGEKLDSPNIQVQTAVLEALRRYSGKRVVDAVGRKLRVGPNVIRAAAIATLEAIAVDGVVPPLVEALGMKQLAVRTRAGEALSSLAASGKVDLARTVMWLLSSRDVNVRRMAVEIAKRSQDPGAELVPKLLRFLRDEDWWVRERVLDALVEIAGPALSKHLVEYLSDPSDVVRRYAIGGLLRVKDPRSVGALVRSAQSDSDWWVREQAILAVAALGDPRPIPHIVEIMNRSPELHVVCLEALAKLRATDAAPDVAGLLRSAEEDVRLAAVQCLAALDDPSQALAVSMCEADRAFAVRRAARELLFRWKIAGDLGPSKAEDASSLLDGLLIRLSTDGGDDLLLAADRLPYMKKHGRVTPIGATAIPRAELRSLLYKHLSSAQVEALEASHDIDFSHEIHSHGLRFRAHVFSQLTGLSAVFRVVKSAIPEMESLGLPAVVRRFGDLKNGLVLVGGPTGSGKSTTLAALVDYINRTASRHIVTMEDPIEVVHEGKKCLINQREIGTHTRSFHAALRSTLRQDPDVILVGELRDLQTISFAVTAAETGHLVFGTVHTVSADTSVDRLVNAFPTGQQDQVRSMLAESLRAVVCQHLLRKKGAEGRVLAAEVMLNNDAVSAMIRKGKTFQIPSVVATSKELGMVSMDAELARLVREGLVHEEEAYMKAIDKKAFEGMAVGKLAEAKLEAKGARA